MLSNLIVKTYDVFIIEFWLNHMFLNIKTICFLPNKFKLKLFSKWKRLFSLKQFQNY
jgi:hypothetical protein